MQQIIDYLFHTSISISLFAFIITIPVIILAILGLRYLFRIIKTWRVKKLQRFTKRGPAAGDTYPGSFQSDFLDEDGPPIILEFIQIRNFKCINEIKLNFTDPSSMQGNWTCIAGINGAGKTTILQAISLLLLGDKLIIELGRRQLEKMIRKSTGKNDITDIFGVVKQGKKRCSLYLPLNKTGIDEDTLLSDKDYKKMKHAWGVLNKQILVSYGSTRNLSEYMETRHSKKSIQVQRQMTLFESLTQIAGIDIIMKESHKTKDAVMKTLRKLILSVTNSSEFGDILSGNLSKIRFLQSGVEVDAIDLPDGFRSTFAWFADLCSAWHDSPYPKRKSTDPQNITGIILIDEISLHLHPGLERSFVSLLRKALPNIQFIATTHSPLVLSSFDKSELIILDNESTDGTRILDRQIFNFTTDQIYEWLMNTRPQSTVLEEKLKEGKDPDLPVYLYQSPERDEDDAKKLVKKRRKMLKRLGFGEDTGETDK